MRGAARQQIGRPGPTVRRCRAVIFPADGFDAEVARLQVQYPFLAPGQARSYVRHYGTRARVLLGNATSVADLGQDFGHGLFRPRGRTT